MKFAYLHIGKNFIENSTKLSYRIHDIVRVTSSSSIPTICIRFFDISSSVIPPTDPALFEYEPIQQFFADPNYLITTTNNNDALLPFDIPMLRISWLRLLQRLLPYKR